MMTVAQVSKRAGVSVRTLHHYDQNGLLKPTEVTEAGYRLYGQAYKRFSYLWIRSGNFSFGAKWST